MALSTSARNAELTDHLVAANAAVAMLENQDVTIVSVYVNCFSLPRIHIDHCDFERLFADQPAEVTEANDRIHRRTKVVWSGKEFEFVAVFDAPAG